MGVESGMSGKKKSAVHFYPSKRKAEERRSSTLQLFRTVYAAGLGVPAPGQNSKDYSGEKRSGQAGSVVIHCNL